MEFKSEGMGYAIGESMDVKIEIKDEAFDNAQAFNSVIQEFVKKALMAKMTRNYYQYDSTDGFCANVLLIEDFQKDGFITEETAKDLGKINRRLNMDWIDGV